MEEAKNIRLRHATLEDAHLLRDWRNDPATRAASLTPQQVDVQEHLAWLTKALKSSARILWIAEDEGVAIGTARLDSHNGRQELSWTVAPTARGMGYGKALVRAALNETKGAVRARIRPENQASAAIARACGFTRVASQGGVETWLFRTG